MIVNISFKKLDGNIIDNYHKTKTGWNNKQVEFINLHKVFGNSKIQFSCYAWNNGVKVPNQFNRTKQNSIIIDIDDGMSIVEFQQMFKKYKYIIGTTKSHQVEKKGIVCDRFRVLIPSINIPENDRVYFRMMDILFPFNDKQTLTKTASFLGNTNAMIITNDGMMLDCYKATEVARKQLLDEDNSKIVIDKDLLTTRGYSTLEEIKNNLTVEIVSEILISMGIEVIGNKCKLRDERSASCKIYPDGYLCDYGGSFRGDLFTLLQERNGIGFGDSINYVRNYL